MVRLRFLDHQIRAPNALDVSFPYPPAGKMALPCWMSLAVLYSPVLALGTFDVVEPPRQLALIIIWPMLAATQVIT